MTIELQRDPANSICRQHFFGINNIITYEYGPYSMTLTRRHLFAISATAVLAGRAPGFASATTPSTIPSGAAFPPETDATKTVSPPASSLIRPGDPIFGNPRGSVTIVDFYDVRCPPCRRMNLRIQRLMRTDHDIRYVPVDYPLLGPKSLLAVQALFAADMQGKYAGLRHILMTQKQPPDMAILKQDAEKIGIDWPRLELDMSGEKVADRIEFNLKRGRALGIKYIPTWFVNAKRVAGSLSEADLRSEVSEAITVSDSSERSNHS